MRKPNPKGIKSPLEHDYKYGHAWLDKYGDHHSSQKVKHFEKDDLSVYENVEDDYVEDLGGDNTKRWRNDGEEENLENGCEDEKNINNKFN